MKILLVGEYSRLHNSLKEGLTKLGHEVTLIGDGDGFKNFPVDINIGSTFFYKHKGLLWFVKFIEKVTRLNIIYLDRAYKFYKTLHLLDNYDVVQLINERPINTHYKLEIRLLKKLFKQNKQVFLLSCGLDYISLKFALEDKYRYSILTPLKEDKKLEKRYFFALRKLKANHLKVHRFLFKHIAGVIASDVDYHLPLLHHNKYLGLIANPINTDKINYIAPDIINKIIIFHGVNKDSSIRKGNIFFDQALAIIAERHGSLVQIIRTENIPYNEYINHYNSCHILLDQVYAYDQGYNALEAMAKGKVVFTGAEQEWVKHYNLQEDTVAINALPDTDTIVKKLEWLINNPKKIVEISKNARQFIETEHHYINIAKKYVDVWNTNTAKA